MCKKQIDSVLDILTYTNICNKYTIYTTQCLFHMEVTQGYDQSWNQAQCKM